MNRVSLVVVSVLATLCAARAQGVASRSTQLVFLPGDAGPVLVSWSRGAYELRRADAAGEVSARDVLGAGALAGGMVPASLRIEPIADDACLLVGCRPLTTGRHLQIAELHRAADGWHQVASGHVDRVEMAQPSSNGGWFESAALLAWDAATGTATVVLQDGAMLPPEDANEESTPGAVYECRVRLSALGGKAEQESAAQLVAVGRDVRTYRFGARCLITTRVTDPDARAEPTGRPGWRLRAWLRDENGTWRDLQVPRLPVEDSYACTMASDGEIAVGMLATVGAQDVLRAARWSRGTVGRGFVVDEEVLKEPMPRLESVTWQLTTGVPVPWVLDANGHAARVR